MNYLLTHVYRTGDLSIKFAEYMENLLSDFGIPLQWIPFSKFIIYLLIAVVVVLVLQLVVRAILGFVITKAHKTTGKNLLDYLVDNRLPHFLALLAPYTFIRNFIPVIFSDYQDFISPATKLADLYLILLVIWSILAIVKSLLNVLHERPAFRHRPMRSYVQVVSIVLYVLGAIIAFSIITEQPTGAVLAAMGAASAVTMLIFQDSIKGFVGSMQMTANNMVELQDWITMDKYKADGHVIEINLTTVKVQNYDNTVITIPTYALISDSFQNWKPMQKSGGRRIFRSLYMKQGSIRFMREEELAHYKDIDCLAKIIEEKKEQYSYLNKKLINSTIPVTNNDLFMAYAVDYLENHHPLINKEFTLMVRQTAPTPEGLPIQLWVFTSKTALVEYERVCTDVMNHLIAMVSYFDLKLFEMLSDTAENP